MAEGAAKPVDKSCCTPMRDGAKRSKVISSDNDNALVKGKTALDLKAEKVEISGGRFSVGTKNPLISGDSEGPVRTIKHDGFFIAPTTVTNLDFAAFVKATGYKTEAEQIGWSFVFYQNLAANIQATQGVVGSEWWRVVDGANWQDIHGPGTKASAWLPDHPVVQVSWNDANAYAQWVGGRLATEVEWEHAARGGQGDVRFPWGSKEPDDIGHFPCNIWQGKFPDKNTVNDGWAGTAPARSYEPNRYGLYNMAGNVWEWTAEPFRIRTLRKNARARLGAKHGFKLLKGGSFLCHRSYCYRYRIAARIGNSPDSATTHQGFRVVWDN